MNWIRESISDEKGSADVAYISIAGLILTLIGSITFLCVMAAIAYFRCTHIVDVGGGVRSALACAYDPNPLGLAIAACLGAFGAPITALAVYMAQTRRREVPRDPPATTTTATATVETTTPTVKPKRRR